ncbi:MAG: hypothetical protein GY773_02515 [Actinomycetia bacterium]|nr:hypothetical protein [Actinomycetes bacterium]
MIEDVLDHDMIAAATDYVCAEIMRSGTTTFHDILEAPKCPTRGPGPPSRDRAASGAAGIAQLRGH